MIYQYPHLSAKVRLHQLPTGGMIEVNHMNANADGNDLEYMDLNQTAYELCSQFCGIQTAEQVLESQCSKYGENKEDHRDWYEDMLQMLTGKQIVEWSDAPFQWDIITSGTNLYPTPLHATIEITHKCNLRCEHCYLEASPEAEGIMSLTSFKNLCNQLYERGVLTLEITGGEVFVHPEIREMLEYALGKFKKIGLLTNGTLLKNEILELLDKYKNKIIIGISLDSVHPQTHDQFRGRKGAFERTCKTIQLLAGRQLYVRVGMSIHPGNMWELKEMAFLVKELGAAAFSYNWVDDFGRGKHMMLEKNREEYRKFIDYEQELIEEFRGLIPVVPYERKATSNCGAGWRSVLIDPNGNIRPCALFPKEFSLGNIFKQTYEEIFDSKLVHTLWKVQSPRFSDACQKECPSRGYCGGCYLKGIHSNAKQETSCHWITDNNLETVVVAMR